MDITLTRERFHELADTEFVGSQFATRMHFGTYSYRFENFFHPRVGALISQLNGSSSNDPIADLLDPKFLAGLEETFFSSEYAPSADVDVTSFPKGIDLDADQPYANYNWELLYHLPVAVAVHLSQNQRFAEAQKWFHYVFDPTTKDTTPNGPARFWRFLYFRQHPATLDLAALLQLFATPDASLNATDKATKASVATSYKASVDKPFVPFAVARPRPIAFQYYVVMKYLDNLIAWGDSLFSQMTIETVNEATLCYVLAANLLGPRPQQVPAMGASQSKCFNDLKSEVNLMGEALVELEGQFPFNFTLPSGPSSGTASSALFGLGQTLYFGVPANAKLLGYWDTVDDRLTKIRNCENIHGQVQLMPLFEPRIDPGMLVKAAAAGLDLSSVIAGLSQPVSAVRSPWLIQKALELAAEVRGLGANLLAAIEKGDAEHLAQLRQRNEITLLQKTQSIRFLQWQQAQAATEALLRSRASALERYTFYLRLVGLAPDGTAAPTSLPVDHAHTLTEDNFDDAYQELVAKYDRTINPLPYASLQLAEGSSPATQSGAAGSGSMFLNRNEDAELNHHMPTARDTRLAASVTNAVAGVLALIPDASIDLHFWGMGAHADIAGGTRLATVARVGAEILQIVSTWEQDQGAMAARAGSYQRRADEWLLQANLAARELTQIGRQLLVSIIAEQAAASEYENVKAQIDQSGEVLDFLRSKFSNEELYGWMQGQLSSLYHQYYRFALDTARKAEATMKWELMRPELDATTYIQPNYWDSGHQGLLTGEALYLDVKRMDVDYHDYNVRELELTRHVSLRQLDPMALLALKLTGSCSVTIPEWLYDRDCPGHYMRRIKTVAVSIPSVVGPYASVNCTLALQHSTVRTASSLSAGAYARKGADDPRFVDYYGTVQSIVTSGAVSDSGMFELNLRDERFLPFEGAGAVSSWQLSLPSIAAFDYATISDVILHVRYTARDGGQALAKPVLKALEQLPPLPSDPGAPAAVLALLVDLQHDFPSEWHAFSSGTDDFSATLTLDFFPYLVQGRKITVTGVTFSGRDSHDKPVQAAAQFAAGTTLATLTDGLHHNRSAVLAISKNQIDRQATEAYAVITYTAHS